MSFFVCQVLRKISSLLFVQIFQNSFFGGEKPGWQNTVFSFVLQQAVNMIILHNKMNYLNTVNLTLFLVLKSLYG